MSNPFTRKWEWMGFWPPVSPDPPVSPFPLSPQSSLNSLSPLTPLSPLSLLSALSPLTPVTPDTTAQYQSMRISSSIYYLRKMATASPFTVAMVDQSYVDFCVLSILILAMSILISGILLLYARKQVVLTNFATVLKRIFEYIRIFEYFLPNIDVHIRFVDIFRIRILFEYSNILVWIFRIFSRDSDLSTSFVRPYVRASVRTSGTIT